VNQLDIQRAMQMASHTGEFAVLVLAPDAEKAAERLLTLRGLRRKAHDRVYVLTPLQSKSRTLSSLPTRVGAPLETQEHLDIDGDLITATHVFGSMAAAMAWVDQDIQQRGLLLATPVAGRQVS
jgi:hypothetical protein